MEGGSTMMDSVPKQKMTGGVERQGSEVKLVQRPTIRREEYPCGQRESKCDQEDATDRSLI